MINAYASYSVICRPTPSIKLVQKDAPVSRTLRKDPGNRVAYKLLSRISVCYVLFQYGDYTKIIVRRLRRGKVIMFDACPFPNQSTLVHCKSIFYMDSKGFLLNDLRVVFIILTQPNEFFGHSDIHLLNFSHLFCFEAI